MSKRPEYRLTHLLEDGHAKRDGGRTKAMPHIQKHEQDAVQEFERRVEEVIKGGK